MFFHRLKRTVDAGGGDIDKINFEVLSERFLHFAVCRFVVVITLCYADKPDGRIVFFTPTIDKEPKKIEYSQVKALMNTQNGADDGT